MLIARQLMTYNKDKIIVMVMMMVMTVMFLAKEVRTVRTNVAINNDNNNISLNTTTTTHLRPIIRATEERVVVRWSKEGVKEE